MGLARIRVMLALLALLGLMALAAPTAASPSGQVETPTPTATPLYEVQHVLPSGAVMIEERRWTWGQLAILASVLVLIAVTILEAVWRTLL